MALSFFPSGAGEAVAQGPILDGDLSVVTSACKKAEDSDSLLIRLFYASASSASAELTLQDAPLEPEPLSFAPFEVKSLLLDAGNGEIAECGMTEELIIVLQGLSFLHSINTIGDSPHAPEK